MSRPSFSQTLFFNNYYVAALAALLAASTEALFLETHNPSLGLLLFFATLLVYNLDRLLDTAADTRNVPKRAAYVASRRGLFVGVSITSALLVALLAPSLSMASLLLLAPLFFISAAYLFLFSYPRGSGRLGGLSRLSPLGKPLLLGLVWSATAVALPLVESAGELGALLHFPGAPWLLAIRFLHYLANGILFDLRDLSGDAAVGRQNIGARLGGGAIGRLLGFVLALASALTVAAAANRLLPPILLVELAVPLIYLYFYRRLSRGAPLLRDEARFIGALDAPLFLPFIYLFL